MYFQKLYANVFVFRAYKLGVQQRGMYLSYKAASLIIQTYFRRYRCRKYLQKVRKAATTIQTTYRMYASRKEYQRTLAAVSTIRTSYFRCSKAKHQRQDFLRKKSAIISIQSAFRGYMYRKHLQLLNTCAAKIQACSKNV